MEGSSPLLAASDTGSAFLEGTSYFLYMIWGCLGLFMDPGFVMFCISNELCSSSLKRRAMSASVSKRFYELIYTWFLSLYRVSLSLLEGCLLGGSSPFFSSCWSILSLKYSKDWRTSALLLVLNRSPYMHRLFVGLLTLYSTRLSSLGIILSLRFLLLICSETLL